MDAAQSVAQGVVAGALDVGATAATAAAYNLGAKGGLEDHRRAGAGSADLPRCRDRRLE